MTIKICLTLAFLINLTGCGKELVSDSDKTIAVLLLKPALVQQDDFLTREMLDSLEEGEEQSLYRINANEMQVNTWWESIALPKKLRKKSQDIILSDKATLKQYKQPAKNIINRLDQFEAYLPKRNINSAELFIKLEELCSAIELIMDNENQAFASMQFIMTIGEFRWFSRFLKEHISYPNGEKLKRCNE
ncbi:hypothetical protein [Pleionea sediminis]|uniref:hypothetical protein n=1 Tax=Pleionea sediminis TaxID=2569479 RepID=UPI00118643DE|nr:hypothetical protein [Pleionea sediminis]